MQDAIRVLAGDCTVTYESDETREQRGRVVVLVKPDGTVLVHDADGYRPAAWLTRADTAAVTREGDDFTVTAASGRERLRVECHEPFGTARFPASPAGPVVGTCPDCGGSLVRTTDRVTCIACRADYGLPDGGRVADGTCGDCGLPTVRVDRGATVEVCLDYECDPLDAALAPHLDGAWDCPDCGTPLAVERARGLRLACPECERAHALPDGTVVGTCACGLPQFSAGGAGEALSDTDGETDADADADGERVAGRCLDPDCDATGPGPERSARRTDGGHDEREAAAPVPAAVRGTP